MARPKVDGPRTASGQLSRGRITVSVNQVRQRIRTGHLDGRWLSAFGRMGLIEESITDRQHQAGVRFLNMRADADRALGIRRIQAQDLNRQHGRSLSYLDEALQTEDDQRAIRRYEAATRAVGGEGSRELHALLWIVIEDREPDNYEQRLELVSALNKLIRHFASLERR